MKRVTITILSIIAVAGIPAWAAAEELAKEIFKAAGTDIGLCVHLGCGREKSADLTANLAAGSRMLVHGLALDDASLARARKAIEAQGLAGRAMVEKVAVNPLPYLPNLANVVVIEDFDALAAQGLTMDEVQRVTAPGGAVCIQKDGRWSATRKPWPKGMDDWTHPAHGPDGNCVSADRVVQGPFGLRWQDGLPTDFLGPPSAFVIAAGRIFTLNDNEYENLAPGSMLMPKKEVYVTARDAFNGLPLWKVNCETGDNGGGKRYYYRNTGPLVTDGKRVYTYKKDRLVALDAATGQVVQSYTVKYPTVRLLLVDGVLVAAGWAEWDPLKKTGLSFPRATARLKPSTPPPARPGGRWPRLPGRYWRQMAQSSSWCRAAALTASGQSKTRRSSPWTSGQAKSGGACRPRH